MSTDFRSWIAICESLLPKQAEPHDLLHLMQQIHHSPEDFENGDINHRIWKFRSYILRDVPTRSLRSSWGTDDHRVKDYANRMRQGEIPPPIIYDLDSNEMIDGAHRLAGAKLAKLPMLPAYVGLPQNIDPDWSESDFEDC